MENLLELSQGGIQKRKNDDKTLNGDMAKSALGAIPAVLPMPVLMIAAYDDASDKSLFSRLMRWL